MTDLVVVSLESWDDVWRRNQHLVSGLLAADPELRVLFVEPPADPLHDLLHGRRPVGGHRARRVRGHSRLVTYRPVKWVPRRLDPSADRRLAGAVLRTARRVEFRHPILWINDPAAAGLSTTSGWPTLYDITDDWLAADRSPVELARLAAAEDTLLATAAEVVACSPELVRRKSGVRKGRPIELVPNAVDAAAYREPRMRPHDLPTGRVAVYVGTLHSDRLDVPLAVRTATALGRSGTLVFVGPDLLASEDSARLREAGAVILGSRPRDEVIGYLQHADALVVPHLVNAFTDSLDPIKLYEYQAVGRPVVSTPVAGFRDAGDSVEVQEPEHFPQGVVDAVEHRSDRRRGVVAPIADWSERVGRVRNILNRIGGDDPAGREASPVTD